MAQFKWHDGSVKNVHVDPTILFDYQVCPYSLLTLLPVSSYFSGSLCACVSGGMWGGGGGGRGNSTKFFLPCLFPIFVAKHYTVLWHVFPCSVVSCREKDSGVMDSPMDSGSSGLGSSSGWVIVSCS